MNAKKIAIISIIIILLLGVITILTANIRPKMHKTIILENIIFKRSTK